MKFKKILLIATISLALISCQSKNQNTNNNVNNKANENINSSQENIKNNQNLNSKADDGKERKSNSNDSIYANPSTMLKGSDALHLALENHSGAQIESVGYDAEDFVYEIKLYNIDSSYEIEINPESGEIIKEEAEKEIEKDFISADQVAKAEDLISKAIKEKGPDFKVDSWEMDIENGVCKIEIELKNSKAEEVDVTYDVD
ncbi:PepSY domain-containing protein [Peptoniphilus catoniae]|uniref:PepSY domain-containing protein n=1 Tax=Peptoniphilus catoniae TaxID=1660341 RepID=UPI0010FED3C6|nr:PepSY domain-containing protein [Peptoniphilus catoniae]